MKTPKYVITSDKWSRDPYVVFEDDSIEGMIPSDWISDRLSERMDAQIENLRWAEFCGEEPDTDDLKETSYDDIKGEMISEFKADASDVIEFWAEAFILKLTNGNYYKYDNDGWCKHIDDEEAIELLPAVKDEMIAAWTNEQEEIANSEPVTPRHAGVMDRFGIDEHEQSEMADDHSILRIYKNQLYVYESQLGEPAQWRLLQPRPHMPTGTLPRPVGV